MRYLGDSVRKSLRLKNAVARGQVRKKVFQRFTLPTKVGYQRFFKQDVVSQDQVIATEKLVNEHGVEIDESEVISLDEDLPPLDEPKTMTKDDRDLLKVGLFYV